ncbi:lantibiotic dehydratase C-terminal domain-containing protein [Sphingobacterium sp. HJSM2_6]|uniref:lantibiotic dehydratase C-terminal domain-containing protein n=1 Tax=Sphingobacterium sp. HJSM2_6 TaxID=3366264 RepID=UPI003BD10DE2
MDNLTYSRVNSLLAQYLVELIDISLQCQRNSDFNGRTTEILASLIHMFLNRVFPQKQREQEMVMFQYLSNYLLTEIKKTRHKV